MIDVVEDSIVIAIDNNLHGSVALHRSTRRRADSTRLDTAHTLYTAGRHASSQRRHPAKGHKRERLERRTANCPSPARLLKDFAAAGSQSSLSPV